MESATAAHPGQHIGRAAHRSRGAFEERVACVSTRTACSRSDAEWAVRREDRPGRSHLLDDAMHKAREEGFEIPRFTSEARVPRTVALQDSRYDGDSE